MPARDAGLIIDSLGNSQSMYTTSGGANVTLSASIAPASNLSRMMLTNLPWSIKNTTAAAVTVPINVRDASINGTVRASWDVIVAAGVTAQDAYAVNIKGVRGQALNVDMGLLASSVTGKITAIGWEEKSSN